MFLLKSLFWLGLVLALIFWPQDERPSAETPKPRQPAEAAKSRRPAPPAGADVVASVTQAATDKLAAAARAQCLAHPSDCLAILGAAAGTKEARGAH